MNKAPLFNLQMKQLINGRGIVYFSLFFIVFVLSSWGCFMGSSKNIKSHSNRSIFQESNLVLNVEVQNSKKILRVSFNGNEGNDGELKIFNNSNQLVAQSNFELIKSPFYASVDISSLAAGNYVVKLTTNVAVHQSSLVLQ